MARHAGQPQLPTFSLGQKVELNPALGKRELNSIQPRSLRYLFRQKQRLQRSVRFDRLLKDIEGRVSEEGSGILLKDKLRRR